MTMIGSPACPLGRLEGQARGGGEGEGRCRLSSPPPKGATPCDRPPRGAILIPRPLGVVDYCWRSKRRGCRRPGPGTPTSPSAAGSVSRRNVSVLPFLSANRGRKEPLDRENPAVPHLKTEEPMFLDHGVVAVEGDRVEVEVEGRPPFQTQTADRVEPIAHQLRVAGRVDSATVFGQEGWNRVHAKDYAAFWDCFLVEPC